MPTHTTYCTTFSGRDLFLVRGDKERGSGGGAGGAPYSQLGAISLAPPGRPPNFYVPTYLELLLIFLIYSRRWGIRSRPRRRRDAPPPRPATTSPRVPPPRACRTFHPACSGAYSPAPRAERCPSFVRPQSRSPPAADVHRRK